MSGQRARGDSAPSLFPFLAVLLCTVGALVLMLVLIVGKSEAAVKEAIDHRADRVEELKSKVESVREAFREDREKIQLEIEKKRMSLESLERQTAELIKELEQLDKTSAVIDEQLDKDSSDEQIESALTDMQKQLEEAAEKLKDKLAKPTNEKPVFAIIPYEGSNGTHRRPIYLECRADGIAIQPEGVFIPLKDLKPPYGPGNPLDAALRTVRQHYSPQGALNSSAYPLLVVRSSGIRTYALARMAMAGWDDQFGYELIEDTMELAYPEGEPALVKELERTLVTARNRQAALVMAMPGRYRQAIEELNEDKITFEDGEGSWGSGEGEAASGSGFGAGFGSGTEFGGGGLAASGGSGTGGSASMGSMAGGGGLDFGSNSGGPGGTGTATNPNLAGGRGGFAFSPDGAASTQAGNLSNSGDMAMGGGSGMRGFATGGQTLSGQPGTGSNQPGTGPYAPGGQAATGMSGNTGDGSGQTFGQAAMNGNQFTRGADQSSGTGSQAGNQTAGQGGGQISSGSGQGSSGNKGSGQSQGTFQDALNAARAKQTGTADAQGTYASSGSESGGGGSQMAGARSEGFGSAGVDASQMGAGMSSPMADLSMNKKDAKKDSEAVAKRKGRNWAWSAGPSRETAVVRNIRVTVLEDRWMIMPDAGSKDKPITIMLDVSLQTSAEQLAKAVADRMDHWGYALSGGYWKPVLQVEVAARSEVRYKQLVRLLDGSGLDIQLVQPGAGSSSNR